MVNGDKEQLKELARKYKKRLEEAEIPASEEAESLYTTDYQQFRKENLPGRYTFYEKWCNFAEKLLKFKPDKKTEPELLKAIETVHLQITPSGAISFAYLMPFIFAFTVVPLIYFITKSLFFLGFFLIVALYLIKYFQKLPFNMANNWRLGASNQMVISVFYIVTYMRHTSNLERAIEFAASRLDPPLSFDFNRVLWDVETGKYDTISESLDAYLEGWRDHSNEFIEAIHLIESSLYEPTETRRLELLDKSLDVILEETYEKMLHYAQNLKSPVTMIHMIGVILPILGLVILPLVAAFMTSATLLPDRLSIVIAMLYNVILPAAVFFIGKSILEKRPTGYGESSIESVGIGKKFSLDIGKMSIFVNPLGLAIFIGFVLLFIGFAPLIAHAISPDFDISIGDFKFLDYADSKFVSGERIGPYGLGASVLSLFIPLGLAFAVGAYYYVRSNKAIKIRDQSKKLEFEFATALAQLGNRLADGMPAEHAFGRVAETMKGTTSGEFFDMVNSNIIQKGFGLEEAIFHEQVGALKFFPSKMIESSMKILIESSKKGPKIAAESLANISRYIKEIKRVDERLKDLLADIIASMKSQISVLTPAIAGIVIGITSMVTLILSKLTQQLQKVTTGGGVEAGGIAGGGILDLFGDSIPTYFFQLIVGVYVFQITWILIILSNRIENGLDKVKEEYSLGTTFPKALVLYCLLSLIIMLLFNLLAVKILDVGV